MVKFKSCHGIYSSILLWVWLSVCLLTERKWSSPLSLGQPYQEGPSWGQSSGLWAPPAYMCGVAYLAASPACPVHQDNLWPWLEVPGVTST